MKKSNFFKTVLGVAAAMLLSSGVFGQNPAAPYALYDADKASPTNIDYVTVGKTLGYYALPDPVFHPNYVASGTLTAGFSWTWGILPAGPTITPGAAALANYATILYPAIGTFAVTVQENSSAAFGGCVGSTTNMIVEVIDAPNAYITTVNPAAVCGNQAAASVTLNFVENVPSTLAAYSFAIKQTIETINSTGTVISTILAATDTLNFPATKVGNLDTGNGLTIITEGSLYGYTFNTRALKVIAGQRTRYTYQLVGATANPTGLVSAISQKSDYLGSLTTYPFTATAPNTTAFVAIVNPQPVTGPIYYIPNNFAY